MAQSVARYWIDTIVRNDPRLNPGFDDTSLDRVGLFNRRGDGGSIPSEQKVDDNTRRVEWGAAGVKGWWLSDDEKLYPWHDQMEDVIFIYPECERIMILGVADGHGGRDAASWFGNRVPSTINRVMQQFFRATPATSSSSKSTTTTTPDDPLQSRATRATLAKQLTEAIKDLDQEFCEMRKTLHTEFCKAWLDSGRTYIDLLTMGSDDEPPDDGCTLSLIIVVDMKWIISLHVGDSRTVIGSRKPQPVSKIVKVDGVPQTPTHRNRGQQQANVGKTLERQRVGNGTSGLSAFSGVSFGNLLVGGNPASFDVVYISEDHGVCNARKAAACHRGGAVWRESKEDPPIVVPEEILKGPACVEDSEDDDYDDSPGYMIPSLMNARVFRPEGFFNPFGLRPKSMAMSDALGDLYMKLSPPIFEARADVRFIKLDPSREYLALIGSDGIWGSLGGEDTSPYEAAVSLLQGIGFGTIPTSTSSSITSACSTPLQSPHVASASSRRSPRIQELKSEKVNGVVDYTKMKSVHVWLECLDTPISPLHEPFGNSESCQRMARVITQRHLGVLRPIFRDSDRRMDDCSVVVVKIGAGKT
ncbi:hypothetical protein HDU76_003215 [Blyttiomyces sp. JEL0837]|nr:hypothetical protein HDU76_003215 [Blyttiomyces sp. JEL0837]